MKGKNKRTAIIFRGGKPLERLEDLEDLKTLKAMRKRPLKFRKLEDFLQERRHGA
jgi:hypothetical protein